MVNGIITYLTRRWSCDLYQRRTGLPPVYISCSASSGCTNCTFQDAINFDQVVRADARRFMTPEFECMENIMCNFDLVRRIDSPRRVRNEDYSRFYARIDGRRHATVFVQHYVVTWTPIKNINAMNYKRKKAKKMSNAYAARGKRSFRNNSYMRSLVRLLRVT